MSQDKKIASIIEELGTFTIIQMNSLVKMLEEMWGVSAAAPMMMGGAAPVAEAVEEQTEFNVILAAAGAKKLDVIKELRVITGLGLKEAKELAEGTNVQVNREALSKADAEAMVLKLTSIGAQVSLV